MEILLQKNVRFIHMDVEDAWDTHIDESDWEDVVLPHDWAVSYPFSEDHSSGTGYLPGGTGWYRIHFMLPDGACGKNITVFFEGVYKHAEVWCNQYYLGQWANGYTPFFFEISDKVKPGQENIIAVRVRHDDTADSRWYTGSGIERPVRIIVHEKVHPDIMNSSFVTMVSADGRVHVQMNDMIINSADSVRNVTVRNYLDDVLMSETVILLKGGEAKTVSFESELTSPKLWSADHPELTEWRVVTVADDGTEDGFVMKTGIRYTEFDPDRGFMLNGQKVKLKGVCLHEDAGSFGNAVPENVWKRRLMKLKAMGANTVRMSHNPHCEALYELCDELGLLVIDELFDEWEGPKNKWWKGHNVYPPKHQGYFLDYPVWHEKDTEAFIKARRNHACVIMWSIGNEIDYPNDPYCHESFEEMTGNNDAGKPEKERMFDPDRPDASHLPAIAAHLAGLVRKYDRSRPVTLASAFPELSANTGLYDELDVIGYNYKEQFYERDHLKFPGKMIFGSENGHGYSEWKAVTDNAFVAGQCLWTGIDYLGETHGWPEHGSRAGHMTTAGFEKADFYFRQSLWIDEPMIRLAVCPDENDTWMELKNMCWNQENGKKVRVEAYTNLFEVELFLNGRSLGRKRDREDGRFVFIVTSEPGELRAEGYIEGRKCCEDVLRTQSSGCGMKLMLLDEELPANGVSVGQVRLDILDDQGYLQSAAEDEVTVTVSGEAKLLHMDNGDLADTAPYTSNVRRTFGGHLMIYIRTTDNKGKVVISAEGRHTGKCELVFMT